MKFNYVIVVMACTLLLSACEDNDSTPIVTIPDPAPVPSTAVSGGGVKGPLANADATVYEIDLTAADLKGTQVATATTDANAKIADLNISNPTPPYLLEFTSVDGTTTDLTTGAFPVIPTVATLITEAELEAGANFYGTPLTSLALRLAARNADSGSPWPGDGDGTTTVDEFMAALPVAQDQIKSTIGLGLASDLDIFTTAPLLDESSTSSEAITNTVAYRAAIEGVTAIIAGIAQGAAGTPQDVLTELADDLADGVIDAVSNGAPAAGYSAENLAILSSDPATLVIPGTDKVVGNIAALLGDETSDTGLEIDTSALDGLTVNLAPGVAAADADGDGVVNIADLFPTDSSESTDSDGDGIGDNGDMDDDNDGVADEFDAFPTDASENQDSDGDGVGNAADDDDDGDGVSDDTDAFPLDESQSEITDADDDGWPAGQDENDDDNTIPGIDFVDSDGDGVGDDTDTDIDGDGVDNNVDSFPDDATENADDDGDGIGNNSDDDVDGDGVANSDDLFPFDSGESQDFDGDGTGDNTDDDRDNDGLSNDEEEAAGSNPLDRDSDDDGIIDGADEFPIDDTEQFDSDNDGTGNNADAFPNDPTETIDTDADGVGDNSDAFPEDETETADTDDDGVGDNGDAFPEDNTESADTDSDGVGDNSDAFPEDETESEDSDQDGVGNNADAFPEDETETADSDGDGTGDNADAFPNDDSETADSDDDGAGDNTDAFPNDDTETTDTDGDGVGDNADALPEDETETEDTDQDGVGNNADTDDDGDGTLDDDDAFPLDPTEDTDTDGDGIGDNADVGFSVIVNLIDNAGLSFYDISLKLTDLGTGEELATGLLSSPDTSLSFSNLDDGQSFLLAITSSETGDAACTLGGSHGTIIGADATLIVTCDTFTLPLGVTSALNDTLQVHPLLATEYELIYHEVNPGGPFVDEEIVPVVVGSDNSLTIDGLVYMDPYYRHFSGIDNLPNLAEVIWIDLNSGIEFAMSDNLRLTFNEINISDSLNPSGTGSNLFPQFLGQLRTISPDSDGTTLLGNIAGSYSPVVITQGNQVLTGSQIGTTIPVAISDTGIVTLSLDEDIVLDPAADNVDFFDNSSSARPGYRMVLTDESDSITHTVTVHLDGNTVIGFDLFAPPAGNGNFATAETEIRPLGQDVIDFFAAYRAIGTTVLTIVEDNPAVNTRINGILQAPQGGANMCQEIEIMIVDSAPDDGLEALDIQTDQFGSGFTQWKYRPGSMLFTNDGLTSMTLFDNQAGNAASQHTLLADGGVEIIGGFVSATSLEIDQVMDRATTDPAEIAAACGNHVDVPLTVNFDAEDASATLSISVDVRDDGGYFILGNSGFLFLTSGDSAVEDLKLADGDAYQTRITSMSGQYVDRYCEITNGSGTATTGTAITVDCSDVLPDIGFNIDITLTGNDNGANATLYIDGNWSGSTFITGGESSASFRTLPDGIDYRVDFTGGCVSDNASGTINGGDVSIDADCSTPQ